MKAQKGVELRFYSFFNLALHKGGWLTPRPGCFIPGNDPVPLYGKHGGSQGRSGEVRKISPPPGFYPRIVQSVASRYTDWAISVLEEFVMCNFNTRSQQVIKRRLTETLIKEEKFVPIS